MSTNRFIVFSETDPDDKIEDLTAVDLKEALQGIKEAQTVTPEEYLPSTGPYIVYELVPRYRIKTELIVEDLKPVSKKTSTKKKTDIDLYE